MIGRSLKEAISLMICSVKAPATAATPETESHHHLFVCYTFPATHTQKGKGRLTDDSCGLQFPNHILQLLHLLVLVSKPLLFVSQMFSALKSYRANVQMLVVHVFFSIFFMPLHPVC